VAGVNVVGEIVRGTYSSPSSRLTRILSTWPHFRRSLSAASLSRSSLASSSVCGGCGGVFAPPAAPSPLLVVVLAKKSLLPVAVFDMKSPKGFDERA